VTIFEYAYTYSNLFTARTYMSEFDDMSFDSDSVTPFVFEDYIDSIQMSKQSHPA